MVLVKCAAAGRALGHRAVSCGALADRRRKEGASGGRSRRSRAPDAAGVADPTASSKVRKVIAGIARTPRHAADEGGAHRKTETDSRLAAA